ncbi:sigma-70 family RNA polymerase sigma factor [Engelhardtia mirabilis]|uniref:ECF RNA polymerase sigma factor SigL n=1 Tax=Engelhardtia mirabilis TaxID=2528011 RepID=A0A518BE19_9BACT|nr:ECF RNA polymerase sigma factor SigL [Planctomycetes bacterium Pla133]QDU99565.1 ECF RNA polymerase sigma factor SigL [Planctomycetes bacterium Pla86]
MLLCMGSRGSTPVAIDELLAEVGWLRALARRLARDSAAADDLTQGTLVAALEHPPSRGEPLRPWLSTVLRNLLRAGHRSDDRRRRRETDAARAEALPAQVDVLAQFEEQRRLAELVAALGEPYRSVLLRHFYRGESAAQIARVTGRPAATVRSQLARALTRLRELHRIQQGGSSHRSIAALGLAAGIARPAGPALWIAACITGVVAMKTSTKLVAAAVAAVLAVIGANRFPGAEEAAGVGAPAARPETGNVTAAASRTATGRRAEGALSAGERKSLPAVAVGAPDGSQTAAAVETRSGFTLRAVDPQGLPIAGARLTLVGHDGRTEGRAPSAPSGADGRITAEIDMAATYRYGAAPERHAALRLDAPRHAARLSIESAVEGSLVELGDLTLELGADLRGRVVDALGIEAAGVEVVAAALLSQRPSTLIGSGAWEPHDGELLLRTETDARGEFALDGLELRPLRLWFRLPGLGWNLSEPIELDAGEVRSGVELVLPPLDRSQLIAGRVVHPDGSPAPEALLRYGEHGYFGSRAIELDEAGRFQFQPPVEAPTKLLAQDPSGAYSASLVAVASPGGDEVVLRLTPLRRCEVAVQSEEGEPLAGAWMMIHVGDEGFGFVRSRTDDDGRCSLVLPNEVFGLELGSDGYEARRIEPLDPIGLGDELVVTLLRKPHLAGVVMAGGDPVAGATLHLVQAVDARSRVVYKGFQSRLLGNQTPIETGADGRFQVPLSEPGDEFWSLLVEKPGLARAEYAIGQVFEAARVPEIVIEMTAGGTLEGRVLRPAGRSVAGVVVAISRADGRPLVTRTDEDGAFRFEHLTPGGWLVEDRDEVPDGRMLSMVPASEARLEPNVVIVEGRTTAFELDTRWKEGLSLRGHLRFDGRGAAGWSAHVSHGDPFERPESLEPVVLTDDGSFEAPALPGTATLILRSPEGGEVERSIEVEVTIGPRTAEVELDLATGAVRGSAGKRGAVLQLVQELGDGIIARARLTAGEGEGDEFEFTGIPVGDLTLMRRGEGDWAVVAHHRLEPGELWIVD